MDGQATADDSSVHRAALVLAAAFLLTGCGVAKEEAAPTQNVRPADLERMVQREHLGPLARGLRLEQDDSGPSNNKQGAEDTIDPKDTARALARAGRVRGYDVTYAAAKPSPVGVVVLGEGVELFRTKKAASNYLKKQFADFKRFRGRTIDGVKIARVEEFDVSTGDEAAGVRITVRYPSRRVTLFATIAAFRRGRVVGNTTALLRRDLLVTGDVERIANALDDRIERVGSGTVRREPVALKRRVRASPDPKPLTLEGKDVRLSTQIVHQRYVTFSGARIYVREYDVLRGRLKSSKIFYLRTMAQVFPNARVAAGNQEFIASRSRRVARRFLRAYFRKVHFTPRGISARPLRWGRDTAGVQFFFKAPKGRIEGIELSVRRGRVVSDVLVMGLDREVETEDLRSLRTKLRARLRRT